MEDIISDAATLLALVRDGIAGRNGTVKALEEILYKLRGMSNNPELQALRAEVMRLRVKTEAEKAVQRKWARSFITMALLNTSRVRTQEGFNRKLNQLNKLEFTELHALWMEKGKPEP